MSSAYLTMLVRSLSLMAKQINATIDKSLNEYLDLIGSCLYNNSLFLNLVKTEAMLFGTHARLSDADFGKNV